jgi:hypothetical protein
MCQVEPRPVDHQRQALGMLTLRDLHARWCSGGLNDNKRLLREGFERDSSHESFIQWLGEEWRLWRGITRHSGDLRFRG